MDQNAFRNLLSTQAVKQGTGRAAGVLGTHAAKRKAGKAKGTGGYTFGKPQAEDKAKEGGKDAGEEQSATAFAPRKARQGGKSRDDGEDKAYQNRAEMRRTGKDDEITNEFREAEKLAEEFEKRAREEGQDEATVSGVSQQDIEEQRKYLGGDATHSILVKGLDYALLAARKAEIEATEGKKAEDELDALLEGGLAESTAGPSDNHDAVEKKEQGVGRKRTREEIVQQLKRQKTGMSTDVIPQPQQTLGSKFKSIAQKKREAEEAQAQALGKKKLKKKKKVVKPTSDAAQGPAQIEKGETANGAHTTTEVTGEAMATQPTDNSLVPSTSDTTEPAQKQSAPQTVNDLSARSRPIPGVTPVPDEEEEDIFGGVGEYVGAVDSDSDTEIDIESGTNNETDMVILPLLHAQDPDPGRQTTIPVGIMEGTIIETKVIDMARITDWTTDTQNTILETTTHGTTGTFTGGIAVIAVMRQESRSPSPQQPELAQSPKTAQVTARSPKRTPSRSPSPVNIDALRALSPSPSLSDADADPYAGPVRPGQSLRALGFSSSDVPSAKELLEMDAIANETAQKRSNKAKWRRAQGMAPQEGAEEDDGVERNKNGKELTEQQKIRRDQQRLQAFMDKKEKASK
ncbi:hypothetical protein QFC19_008781 [Naganishia cerealis]|uniref:Uncharacterized protein n=1 Tax=Naganishia cerealis TaxID=610337 RepID=A0ACC2UYT7_9TREE|nr:hypothetical protein QFC19_008781 [Naganishia cerealis]